MNKILTSTLLAISIFASTNTFADVLILTDGQALTGTLVSRDASGVVFDIAGQQLKFDSSKVKSISFGDATPTKTPEQPAALQPNQVNNQAEAPAGSRMVIKTNTAIDSRQHKTGHKFTTRLEADLVADNVVIAPRGATVYGVIAEAKKSGRIRGSSSLIITFTDIMLNNKMIPIQTSGVKAVTEDTAKSTVGRTARLAAVGGLANGSKGAKNAAKVGVGVSILSSGNSINIPAGTLLEFQLAMPLKVQ